MNKRIVSILMDDKEYRLPEEVTEEVIYNMADLLLNVRPHGAKFFSCYYCVNFGCTDKCKQSGCQDGVAKYLLKKYKQRYRRRNSEK